MTNLAKPRSESPSRNRLADIIGDRVSATMPEIVTAPAKVKANSRNSEPVRPPCSPMGRYTATSVAVIAITGPTNSRAPRMAASKRLLPSLICRSTFSTTTMASSTTKPTDSTIANNVRRFTLKPNICIRKTAPINEIGIAMMGTMTDRREPRNRKITNMTISNVSISVVMTSRIELSIY